MEAEFWAYHYAESDAKEEFEDDDFDQINSSEVGSIEEWEELINEQQN